MNDYRCLFKHQIFHLGVVNGLPAGEIARQLQVRASRVYLVRHRLARELKREIARLRAKPL